MAARAKKPWLLYYIPPVLLAAFLAYRVVAITTGPSGGAGTIADATSDAGPPAAPTKSIKEYLADPKVAAGKDEKPVPPQWDKLGTYKPKQAPFGGKPPRAVLARDLPGANPETKQIWLLLDDGQFDALRSEVAKLRAKEPTNLQAMFLAGEGFKNSGENVKAQKLFEQIIAQVPGAVRAYVRRGSVLLNQGKYREAVSSFTHAAVIAPDAEIHNNRGMALCDMGRYQEAEHDLWKLSLAEPDQGNGFYMLALVHANRKDPKGAVRLLRFAARDPLYFRDRMHQEAMFKDPGWDKIRNRDEFQKYLSRLPAKELPHEEIEEEPEEEDVEAEAEAEGRKAKP